MPAGGLIVAGVIGAGTAIYGAIQKDKAAKAARANVRPAYGIPQEEYQNLSLAESQAGQGMSDAARQQLQNNASAGLAGTQNAILRAGGSANAIASAEEKYQQGINQNAIYDDQARVSNLRNLQSAYTRMSADKDKEWQINQYGSWADKAQAISQQAASADKTMWSGINTVGSAASGIAGSGSLGSSTASAVAAGRNSAPSAPQAGVSPSDSGGMYNASNNFTNSGNGSNQDWKWNGYYPVQQF